MDELRPLRPLKQRASMPSFAPPRRHSTVPSSFQPEAPQTAQESASNGSVETLYSHPSVRIIAFTAGKSAFDRPGQEDKPGTLPSSSQFERPIAFGAFQIYRAPGSVAFLRSGAALQPILPKSQAWCLDEESSKFVLQIRRPSYWRIEIPVGNDEELRRAHMLREVLDKILQFEKTPCPFERNFTVELPEAPQTPIKKRMWTPPARTVSMNWPPGSPVTSPPEFVSRTRFYNPGARRHSDLGLDMSRMGLTPAASPQIAEQMEGGAEKSLTPPRRDRRDVSSNICGPLLEEPESLSTSPTTLLWNIPQFTEDSNSQRNSEPPQKTEEPLAATSPGEVKTVEAPARKREPIWVTKERSPDAAGKSLPQRPAILKTQSEVPIQPAPRRPAKIDVDSPPTDSSRIPSSEFDSLENSPQSTKQTVRESTGELEAVGGALEGSGQLRVRRTRLAAFASRRAATAPALRLRTPSASTTNSGKESTSEPEEAVAPGSPAESSAESLDSFHSLESWHEPLSPPAPSPLFSSSNAYPYPHEYVPLALNKGQESSSMMTPTVSGFDRNSSGAVAGSGCRTPDTPFTEMNEDDRSPPRHLLAGATGNKTVAPITVLAEEEPSVPNDSDSFSDSWSSTASHTSNNHTRHRASTTSVSISHRSPRGLSPLPPAATLLNGSSSPSFNNSNNNNRNVTRAIRRIPSSIFNKTCEILISPPAHLISLMLKVAARISAGEWRGFVFGLGEGGELVDIRWDWTDDDLNNADDMGPAASWEEEDFGFANAHRGRETQNIREATRPHRKVIEYQDPWATGAEEPDADDEDGHWSRSWGVD